MNKKGTLVLRDVIFMMMIVSAIFVFAGLFVSELAFNYENTNMTNEWALTQTNTLANSTFSDTKDDVTETGSGFTEKKESGIFSLLSSAGQVLSGIGDALIMVLAAPNTIGKLVSGTLQDAGVASSIAVTIKWLIVTILWGVIIFTIASAFLRGPRV